MHAVAPGQPAQIPRHPRCLERAAGRVRRPPAGCWHGGSCILWCCMAPCCVCAVLCCVLLCCNGSRASPLPSAYKQVHCATTPACANRAFNISNGEASPLHWACPPAVPRACPPTLRPAHARPHACICGPPAAFRYVCFNHSTTHTHTHTLRQATFSVGATCGPSWRPALTWRRQRRWQCLWPRWGADEVAAVR